MVSLYHGKASRTTSLSDLSTPSPALDPIGRCRRRYKRRELAGVLCVREEVWKLPLQSTVEKANRGYFDLTIKVDVLKVLHIYSMKLQDASRAGVWKRPVVGGKCQRKAAPNWCFQ